MEWARTLFHPVSSGAEFYQDFRGQEMNNQGFRLIDAKMADLIRSEPAGLRITLPVRENPKIVKGKPASNRVGLKVTFRVKGDFEITTGYEILEADRPQVGSGVGFTLYLSADTAAKDALNFRRVVRPKEGDVYNCGRYKTDPDNNRSMPENVMPAQSRIGQVRLTRIGSQLSVWAAEGPGEDFQELRQYEFVTEDVNRIELAAYQASPNPVDIRFKDFRIRAESLPGVPDTTPVARPSIGGKVWFVIAFATLIGISTLVASWLTIRQSRRKVKSDSGSL